MLCDIYIYIYIYILYINHSPENRHLIDVLSRAALKVGTCGIKWKLHVSRVLFCHFSYQNMSRKAKWWLLTFRIFRARETQLLNKMFMQSFSTNLYYVWEKKLLMVKNKANKGTFRKIWQWNWFWVKIPANETFFGPLTNG